MKKHFLILVMITVFSNLHAQFGEHAYYNYSGEAMKFSVNNHRTGDDSGLNGLFEFQWGEGYFDSDKFAIAGFAHHGLGGGYTKEGDETGVYFRVYEELGFLFMYSIAPKCDVSVSLIPSYLDLSTQYVVWGFGMNTKVRYSKFMAEGSFVPLPYKELMDPGYFQGAVNCGFHDDWMVGLKLYHSAKSSNIGLCFTWAVL